jgi:hypothetical protein
MATIIAGERVGKYGRLVIGCSATIVDAAGEKMLLTRRGDNGQWCVPDGFAQQPATIICDDFTTSD